ncbi:MAG: hypothetical protein NTV63_05075 [Candidatus Woesearchaeota archaeon]|nr:hypothetical protein [Candidatus Woesearchaeota archaeon]
MAFLEFAGSVYDLIRYPSLKVNSEPMLNSFENPIQKIETNKNPDNTSFKTGHSFMNSQSGIFSLKMDFRFSENQDKNLSYVLARFEENKNISTFKSYVKSNNREKVADWETINGYYLIITNQKSLRGTVYLDKIYFS